MQEAGRQIAEHLSQAERLRGSAQLLTDDVLFAAFQSLSGQFDDAEGGVRGAPKFPQPMIWDFVLRMWKRTGNPRARQMVTTTLTRMARGGMYDQLGGGFARYSVDDRWLVPHFEKMLYDNAQLASLYLGGWLAFGDPEYRRIAEETLDYVLREMTDPVRAASTPRRTPTPRDTRASSSCGPRRRSADRCPPARRTTRSGTGASTAARTSRGRTSSSWPESQSPSGSRRRDAGSSRRESVASTRDSTTRSSPHGTVSPVAPSRRPVGRWGAPTT